LPQTRNCSRAALPHGLPLFTAIKKVLWPSPRVEQGRGSRSCNPFNPTESRVQCFQNVSIRVTHEGDQPHHLASVVRKNLFFLTPQLNQFVGHKLSCLSSVIVPPVTGRRRVSNIIKQLQHVLNPPKLEGWTPLSDNKIDMPLGHTHHFATPQLSYFFRKTDQNKHDYCAQAKY